MRKKLSFLSTALFVILLSMMVFPMVGNAQEQCARIDYVANYRDGDAYFSFGKRPSSDYWYYTDAPDEGTYFQVTADHGAVVSFGTREGKMTETQPDGRDTNGDDVYRFFISAKMAKNGGKKLVTARLGSVETKLTVEFKKAKIENGVVKGNFDATDKRYEYGKITAKAGDAPLTEYVLWKFTTPWYEEDCDGDKLFVDEDTTVDAWNAFMKPLAREGETIYVSHTGWNRWADDAYVSENRRYWSCYTVTDTSWTISTEGYIYKTGKVKIAAQKAAPKVKVDAAKGTLSTNAKMEYIYKPQSAGENAYSAWTAAAAKQKISAITSPSIVADGLDIRVRIAGTDKKLPSCYRSITIPSRGAIDLSKIQLTGVSTNASIKISDLDASQKPYEYTMETPGDSTIWKKIPKTGITFKGKTALSDGTKIYIREKGVNENTKKSIFLKMPSTIAEITVSGAAVEWKKEAYDMTKFDKRG